VGLEAGTPTIVHVEPTLPATSGDASAYDLFARGSRLLRSGDPHAAALVLGRAKLIEPEKASIREALGRALYMSGRIARARREFAKAVQLHPTDDYAHFALALACEKTGQTARARAHLKLALALKPGVADYERALRRLTA
jgi:Flp pilus assembly protein TadD